MAWAEKSGSGKSLKADCSRLAFSAAIYQFWAQKNAITF